MDGWVEKKKRKKTDRNRVLDVDKMLDEIDAEDPVDDEEIERIQRLEEEFGDLRRFTPDEVEDLLGPETPKSGDREPKPSEHGDREPKPNETGDHEPKPNEAGDRKPSEAGDHEPKPSEPGDREQPMAAQQKYAEAHLKIFGSDAITLDDSSSETDLATMEALVEQRNFVHPDAVATDPLLNRLQHLLGGHSLVFVPTEEKDEQGLDTSKGNAKKKASGDTIPDDEGNKKKKKGKKAPEEPNKTFAGRPPPTTTPFLWRFQFAAEAFQEHLSGKVAMAKDKAERKFLAYVSEQGLSTMTDQTEIEIFCHDMA
ncbi:unnamed protein product, partial [Symbiodinium sp. CCMP2592]